MKITDKFWKSIVTIEVDESKKNIQMKATFNSEPDEMHRDMIETWAKEEGLKIRC